VVILGLEDRRVTVGRNLVPVAQKEMDRRGSMQLAEDPLQVVAAVAVEQQDLANAVRRQRIDQVS